MDKERSNNWEKGGLTTNFVLFVWLNDYSAFFLLMHLIETRWLLLSSYNNQSYNCSVCECWKLFDKPSSECPHDDVICFFSPLLDDLFLIINKSIKRLVYQNLHCSFSILFGQYQSVYFSLLISFSNYIFQIIWPHLPRTASELKMSDCHLKFSSSLEKIGWK